MAFSTCLGSAHGIRHRGLPAPRQQPDNRMRTGELDAPVSESSGGAPLAAWASARRRWRPSSRTCLLCRAALARAVSSSTASGSCVALSCLPCMLNQSLVSSDRKACIVAAGCRPLIQLIEDPQAEPHAATQPWSVLLLQPMVFELQNDQAIAERSLFSRLCSGYNFDGEAKPAFHDKTMDPSFSPAHLCLQLS